MTEDERLPVRLSRGMPEARLVGRLLGKRGEAFAEYVVEKREQAEYRVGSLLDAAVSGSHEEQAEFIEQIAAEPRLASLLDFAVAAAARTRLEAKARALGRALALGTLTADDAEVNRADFFLRSIDALEVPHVQVLTRLGAENREQPGHLRILGISQLAREAPTASKVMVPVVSALEREGLVTRWYEGTFPGGGAVTRFDNAGGSPEPSVSNTTKWATTGYGRDFLEFLADTELIELASTPER